jgi:hypothetical protein
MLALVCLHSEMNLIYTLVYSQQRISQLLSLSLLSENFCPVNIVRRFGCTIMMFVIQSKWAASHAMVQPIRFEFDFYERVKL